MAESKGEVFDCIVRGYSHYKKVWRPYIGQDLQIQHETGNQYDKNAMAVYIEERVDEFTELVRYIRSQYLHARKSSSEMNGLIKVGYLPREISSDCCRFVKNGGTIMGVVTDQVRRSDIGKGLEVPCQLTFKQKDKTLVKDTLRAIYENYTHSYDYISPERRQERTIVPDTTASGTPYETFGSRVGVVSEHTNSTPGIARAVTHSQYPSNIINHDEVIDKKDIKRNKCHVHECVSSITEDYSDSVECKKPKLKDE